MLTVLLQILVGHGEESSKTTMTGADLLSLQSPLQLRNLAFPELVAVVMGPRCGRGLDFVARVAESSEVNFFTCGLDLAPESRFRCPWVRKQRMIDSGKSLTCRKP